MNRLPELSRKDKQQLGASPTRGPNRYSYIRRVRGSRCKISSRELLIQKSDQTKKDLQNFIQEIKNYGSGTDSDESKEATGKIDRNNKLLYKKSALTKADEKNLMTVSARMVGGESSLTPFELDF